MVGLDGDCYRGDEFVNHVDIPIVKNSGSNGRKKWICHLWGRSKHIRLLCDMFHNLYHINGSNTRKSKLNMYSRTEWRPKGYHNLNKCKIALTSIHNSKSTNWYFDSGCSHHITRNAMFFSELNECQEGLLCLVMVWKEKALENEL